MADMETSKPRRKLVTYGKPVKRVQKNIIGFESMKAASPPSVSLPFNKEEAANSLRPVDFELEDSSSGFISASNDEPIIGKKQASSKSNVEGRIGERDRLHKPAKKMTQASEIDAGLFDVPSSDDEEEAAKSGARTPRKRRRLSPTAINTGRTILDEDNLQLHIALGVPAEVHKSHTANTGLVAQAVKAQKRSANSWMQPERRLRTRTHSVDSRAPVIRDRSSESRSSQSSSSATYKRKQAPKSRANGIDLSPLRGAAKRGRSHTPKQTSSPSAKSETTTSSTPRRAILLGELLEDAAPENSPSRLGLKRLTLAGSAGTSPGSEAADGQLNPPKLKGTSTLRELHRPRPRLIDALGKSAIESLNSMSDGDSSDNDSESSLSARRPYVPEIQVDESAVPESNSTSTSFRASESQSQSSSQPTGLFITYAKQRSYLSDIILDDVAALDDAPDSQLRPLASGVGGGSQVSLASIIEDDDIAGGGAGSGLRSIHELRQAGGIARVLSDIESILEDIDDRSKGSSSRRRGGLMELCTKLIDIEFTRQFLDNAMVSRLVSAVSGQADSVMTFLTVAAISLLLCGGSVTTPDVRACCQKLLESSPSLIGEQRELGRVARERQFNMSKASQASLIDLQQCIRKSRIWNSEQPQSLSPQIMALRSIDLAVRRLRELGDLKETLPNPTMKHLISILLSKVAQHQAHNAGDDLLVIQLTTSILESNSLATGPAEGDELDLIENLSELGPLLSLGTDRNEEYLQMQTLALKLILNVTNNNLLLCERFAKPELISAIFRIVATQYSSVSEELRQGKESSYSDQVILAIGSLLNFTEWSDLARKLMAQLRQESVTFLELLIRLFLGEVDSSTQAVSVAETHSLIQFGYLSVLLCTVCLNAENRAQVRNRLSGRNLEQLLGAAEYFLMIYKKLEEDTTEEDVPKVGFIKRIQGIVDRLRQTGR